LKPKHKKKKPGEFQISKNLVFGSILGIAIVVVAFVVFQGQSNSQEDVAAIVNGEVISVTELNKAFDSLPQQFVGSISKESLLNQLIQTKVFYQEAEKQGLVVDYEEANQQFQLAKDSSGLTEEQFSANLLAEGITKEELIDQYVKELTIRRFIEENLIKKIQVSDEEKQDYYDNNLEKFQVDEVVVVKHILIGNEDLTPEEQDTKAEELLTQLTEDNFCEFVNDFSTDTASLPTCGEYTFTPKDAYVEEFKKLSFEQDIGDMGIVRTQFGPHIIWTVEKTPAETLPLDEISDQISNFLKNQKGEEQFEGFYQDVSKDSEIEIIFLGT